MACMYAYYFTHTSPADAFVLPFFMWYIRITLHACFNFKIMMALFSFRFPFDCKNPVGYTVGYAIECTTYWSTFFWISSCVACLGIVAFLLALAKDLTNVLRSIQKNIKTKNNRLNAIKQLHKFIQFHSTIKEFSLEINFGFYSKSDNSDSYYFLQIREKFHGNLSARDNYCIVVEYWLIVRCSHIAWNGNSWADFDLLHITIDFSYFHRFSFCLIDRMKICPCGSLWQSFKSNGQLV